MSLRLTSQCAVTRGEGKDLFCGCVEEEPPRVSWFTSDCETVRIRARGGLSAVPLLCARKRERERELNYRFTLPQNPVRNGGPCARGSERPSCPAEEERERER